MMLDDQELAKRLAELDERDKRLRQQMTKQTELKAKAYVGTCPDMCPERERYTRLLFQPSIFERDQYNQPDERAMVKEYRRAGADQEEPLPHDLRTLKALGTTMDYLSCNIMDDPRSKSQDLALDWYDFLWDRLRAIRKDITQQNICDSESAMIVERCTRFHVHSCYAMNRIKDFDVDINKRNLNDCLQMLRRMYSDLRETGVICNGEIEFQKYDILLHLDEDPLSTHVLIKTSDHRSSEDMKFTIQVFNAYSNNDYYRFFKLFQQADYMSSCILSLYINKMRLIGFKIIIAACTSRQVVWYPADLIIETLGFDDIEDLKAFAATFEIDIELKDLKYYILINKDLISTIRQSSTLLPPKSSKLVENKMNGLNVGQLIYGMPLLADRRMSFDEEETITTIIEEEEDIRTGNKTQISHKETSTIHKFVLTGVKESDEAIYSFKAENDLGNKSLVSLTVDKRKEVVDELSEARRKKQESAVVEEEETATTVTKTTTEEHEEDLDDIERRNKRTSTRKMREEDKLEEEDEGEGGKRRTTTRTTRTTTKTTTTTEEEEEEEEEARRRKKEREQEEQEERQRSKRKTVVEEGKKEMVERRIEVAKEGEEVNEVTQRKLVELDVEEVVDEVEDGTCRKRKSSSLDEESNNMDEESIKRRKMSRTQTAIIMPAGRFRRCKFMAPTSKSQIAPLNNSKVTPTKQERRQSYDAKLESLVQRISDEKKANESLFTIIRMLL